MSDKKIYSLKGVVRSIQLALEDRFKQAYWIKVELHKLNQYPTGHCFPELVQKENDKIVAQISGTLWKQTFTEINKRFHEIVKEPIKEGTNLLVYAKVYFHPTFGVGLLILDIDPQYSLGELEREKEETLKYLRKYDLLNKNKSLPFPLLPKKIAIISAETSKGLSDFNSVLKKRSGAYHILTHLFRASLQGDAAVQSILRQLEKIEKYKELFDVVVIVRGGGGEAGMTCYNNLELCKKIANFPLPILTGIGHSTNTTVAEMIAFENGITPTELAEIIIRCFDRYAEPLFQYIAQIEKAANRILKENLNAVHSKQDLLKARSFHLISKHLQSNLHLKNRLWNASKNALNQKFLRQKQSSSQLTTLIRGVLSQHKNSSIHLQQMINIQSKVQVKAKQLALLQLKNHMHEGIASQLESAKQNLIWQENKLELLSPEKVLKRGFSITQFNGKSISLSNQPVVGDKIITFTANTVIHSNIENLDQKE